MSAYRIPPLPHRPRGRRARRAAFYRRQRGARFVRKCERCLVAYMAETYEQTLAKYLSGSAWLRSSVVDGSPHLEAIPVIDTMRTSPGSRYTSPT